jgi:poly-gamma-glutamate capsule biosynthesis protein CapA/YwtB (metallophosphatase superfamily)
VTSFLDQRRHALARIAAGDSIADVLDQLIYAVEDTANKQAEAALRGHIDRLKTFNQLSNTSVLKV